jgi:hypothetical protein
VNDDDDDDNNNNNNILNNLFAGKRQRVWGACYKTDGVSATSHMISDN